MAYILKEGTTGWEGTSDADAAAIRSGLTAGGFVVKTKAIHDQDVQTAIDEAFGKRNKQIEDTIAEVTGLPKQADEKYFDYLKRAVPARLAEIKTLQDKITKYEKEGIDPKGLAKELQEQIEALKGTHAREKKELTDRVATFETQNFASRVDLDINKAVDKLRPIFKEMDVAIATDVIERRVQKFKAENIAKQIEGGIIIFTGPDGKARRNEGNAQPAGVEEIIGPYFADLIDEGRKQAGAGSGPAGTGQGGVPLGKDGKQDWKTFKLPAELKTKVQVHAWLKNEQKLNESTKEFSEAYTELTSKVPNMPMK